MVEQLKAYKNQFFDFYQRHEVLVSAGVFVFGFVFDLLTLGRIDDLLNLIQQAVYLSILGTLLLCEIRIKIGTLTLSERGKKFWEYHDLVVHFLFGSLLSVYTIFYYTSASAFTSLLFILLLAGLMLANEFPQFQKLGLPVRVILFSICVLSYFSFFYPILIGHVGAIPFWLGVLSSAGVLGIIWKLNFKNTTIDLLKRHVLYPSVAVHLLFVIGYYASLIPPVPVAVKKIGVYYNVEKRDGNYIGHHLRPFWRFWSKGSQTFEARTGDKVVVLLSIFSPARFEDKVFLKWYFDDPREGWTLHDSIPLSILGGRDEGFRGFGTKSHYQSGDWRVIVETSDGREVGRISLTIEADDSTDPREFKQDVL
jgi:hypothetical protein